MKHNYIFIDYENTQPANLELLNRPDIFVILFIGSQQTKIPIDIVLKMQSMGERARYIKVSKTANNALDFHIAFYMGKILAHVPKSSVYIISKDTDYEPLINHLKEQGISAALCEEIEQLPFLKSVRTRPLQLDDVPKTNQKRVTSPSTSASPRGSNATSKPQNPSNTLSTNTTPIRAQHTIKPIVQASTTPAVTNSQANNLTKQNELIQTILEILRKIEHPPRTQETLINHIFAHLRHKIQRNQVPNLIAILVKQQYITLTGNKVTYHLKDHKKEAA